MEGATLLQLPEGMQFSLISKFTRQISYSKQSKEFPTFLGNNPQVLTTEQKVC
jgi:hypothetical protein